LLLLLPLPLRPVLLLLPVPLTGAGRPAAACRRRDCEVLCRWPARPRSGSVSTCWCWCSCG